MITAVPTTYRIETERGTATMDYYDGVFFVSSVAVDADHRGRGHGRRLMELVIERANAYGCGLELRVFRSNEVAVRLYTSLGFVETDDPVFGAMRPKLIALMARGCDR